MTETVENDIELKEAFNLFDVYSTGLLDIKLIHDAFKSLGFDKDSYSVWFIILGLSQNKKVKEQGGVDYPTFKNAVDNIVGDFKSKEGLRKLFELFVDDPKEDKITITTLRRVSNELGDNATNTELKEVMKRSAENGIDIDFEEFYKILINYKNLHSA
jgi:Ca2+-binding EF-hand superfamily protein